MKNWNVPVMEELSVVMTAAGQIPGTSENDNGHSGDWISRYDTSVYEENVHCGDGKHTLQPISEKASMES